MFVKSIPFAEVWCKTSINLASPDRRLVIESGELLNVWFDNSIDSVVVDSLDPLHHAIIKQEYATPIYYDVVGFNGRGVVVPPKFK